MTIPLSGSLAGRWCGGVYVTPAELAGPESLAATPVYLDHHDALVLFVWAAGGAEAAAASLAEYDPAQLDASIAKKVRERDHDRIADYWDRQP